ncbi:MAG: hypothetical protein Roseis2KO_17080 [Roseivirga sp.]
MIKRQYKLTWLLILLMTLSGQLALSQSYYEVAVANVTASGALEVRVSGGNYLTYAPENTTDKSRYSLWIANEDDGWIQYEFEKPVVLSQMVVNMEIAGLLDTDNLRSRFKGRVREMIVELSNGRKFNAKLEGESGPVTIKMPKDEVTWVRLIPTKYYKSRQVKPGAAPISEVIFRTKKKPAKENQTDARDLSEYDMLYPLGQLRRHYTGKGLIEDLILVNSGSVESDEDYLMGRMVLKSSYELSEVPNVIYFEGKIDEGFNKQELSLYDVGYYYLDAQNDFVWIDLFDLAGLKKRPGKRIVLSLSKSGLEFSSGSVRQKLKLGADNPQEAYKLKSILLSNHLARELKDEPLAIAEGYEDLMNYWLFFPNHGAAALLLEEEMVLSYSVSDKGKERNRPFKSTYAFVEKKVRQAFDDWQGNGFRQIYGLKKVTVKAADMEDQILFTVSVERGKNSLTYELARSPDWDALVADEQKRYEVYQQDLAERRVQEAEARRLAMIRATEERKKAEIREKKAREEKLARELAAWEDLVRHVPEDERTSFSVIENENTRALITAIYYGFFNDKMYSEIDPDGKYGDRLNKRYTPAFKDVSYANFYLIHNKVAPDRYQGNGISRYDYSYQISGQYSIKDQGTRKVSVESKYDLALKRAFDGVIVNEWTARFMRDRHGYWLDDLDALANYLKGKVKIEKRLKENWYRFIMNKPPVKGEPLDAEQGNK